MNQAIGLIEVAGLATAIKTADTMLKAANVTFKTMEKAKGSGWMVIVIEGDVGAVNAAINSGEADAKQFGKFISSKVIARPAQGLEKVFEPIPTEAKEEPVEEKEKPAAKKAEPAKEEAKKPAAKAASAPKETPAKAQTEKAKPEKPAPKKQEAKAQDKTTHTKEAEKKGKAK